MAVFVLVHGAGTGGWLWRRVREPLQRAGHDVFTPTLTGMGERAHLARRDIGLATHVDDVVGLVEHEELSDIVLVGFSYSGMIIPGVADRLHGRVRRLVYIDSVVPDNGKSLLDMLPADYRETWQRLLLAGDGWRVPPVQFDDFGARDEGGYPEAEIIRLLARREPMPLACFAQPVTIRRELPPQIYIRCSHNPPTRGIADELRARGWEVRELATGHYCMLTMPASLARLLDEIAKL